MLDGDNPMQIDESPSSFPEFRLPGSSLKERLDREVERLKNEQKPLSQDNDVSRELKPTIEEKYSPPNIVTMAKTFINSTSNWVKAGAVQTDEQTLNKRIDECKNCEFWNSSEFRGTGRCMKCGCSTWAKLRMATEKCPIGKW